MSKRRPTANTTNWKARVAKSRERSRELLRRSKSVDRKSRFDRRDELHRYALTNALRDVLFESGFARASMHKEFASKECVYVKTVAPGLYVAVHTTIRFHECAPGKTVVRVEAVKESPGGKLEVVPGVATAVKRRGTLDDIVTRVLAAARDVEGRLK